MQKDKILQIDDTLDMLLIGQRIFNRAGYQFISAQSGEEGLNKALSEKPDIIILDYLMQDMDGATFLKILTSDPRYESVRETPCVILTAKNEEPENLDEYFSTVLRSYLKKPFGHRELVMVVENFLRISKIKQGKPTTESASHRRRNEAKPQGILPEQDALEDVNIIAATIMSLVTELVQKPDSNLCERDQTDLLAILNSSKRLIKIVETRGAKDEIG